MTQKRWWIAAALVSALLAGTGTAGAHSECTSGRKPDACPATTSQEQNCCTKECRCTMAVLGKLPCLGELFKLAHKKAHKAHGCSHCASTPKDSCRRCPCNTAVGCAAAGCFPYPLVDVCPSPAMTMTPAHAVSWLPMPAPVPMPIPGAILPPPLPMPPPVFSAPPPVTLGPVSPPYQFASVYVPEPREFVVEMKLIKCSPDGKENVEALPKLTLMEGQQVPLQISARHADLWQQGFACEPGHGHEGLSFRVMVRGAGKDRAHVDLIACISEAEHSRKCPVIRESSIHCRRMVSLGKMTKLRCDHFCHGEHVRCRLEMTVREQEFKDISVCVPPARCALRGTAEACEQPCRTAAWVAPEPKPMAEKAMMKITTVEAPCCEECEVHGKMCDVTPPTRLLQISWEGTCLVCSRTELKTPGHEALKLHVEGDQVVVCGEGLTARADCIMTDQKGTLVFEGHAHISTGRDHGNCVEVEAGKVKIKLHEEDIIRTGVISDPRLAQ